jgi:hypothetical protein
VEWGIPTTATVLVGITVFCAVAVGRSVGIRLSNASAARVWGGMLQPDEQKAICHVYSLLRPEAEFMHFTSSDKFND